MIPYDTITESADRRWTFRLLDRFLDPELPTEELDDLVPALEAVSDRRIVPILERVLADTSRPTEIREAAGTVLRDMQYLDVGWSEETVRGWWATSDPVLRRHALLRMGAGTCPDILRRVATDPNDPLRAAALGRMTFFFDNPADLRLKVAALTDPDPTVREATAALLYWDEPVAAESALVAATGDLVKAVATEAAATLQYYPSVRVIRCLHGLLDHPAEQIRDTARRSLNEIRYDCLLHARDDSPKVAAHVRRWLTPVRDLLAFTAEELAPPAEAPCKPSAVQETRPLALPDILRLLLDPDTSPKVIEEQLWAPKWKHYPVADRSRLRPVLLNHPDPLIRQRGTTPFQEWSDASALLELLSDSDAGVRRSAMYCLERLPQDPRIAAVAWDHLHRPKTFGIHASETLSTFAAHADRRDAIPKLLSIATDATRVERLRVSAVRELAGLAAIDEVKQLTTLLAQPPAVTWGVHIAILDAVADFELTVAEAPQLRDADNLHVRVAVARAIGGSGD